MELHRKTYARLLQWKKDSQKQCFFQKIALGEALHRKMMNLFRQYLLVGGMPQAVLEYVDSKDFARVDQVKRRILKLYRDDVGKFVKGHESRVLAIFDEIPSQLSRHEKKFQLASLEKSARFRDYEDAFVWLDEAKVINICFNATDPEAGLALYQDRMTMKCYFADTGLLVTQSMLTGLETRAELYKALLFDRLALNQGMFMENIVAQSLVANGHKLFFYSRQDRLDSQNTIEIDFLIRPEKKICPVEVKSSAYTRLSSLEKFRTKFGGRLGTAYLIHTKDFKVEQDLVFLPLYMCCFL